MMGLVTLVAVITGAQSVTRLTNALAQRLEMSSPRAKLISGRVRSIVAGSGPDNE